MYEYYVRKFEDGKDGSLTKSHSNESKKSIKRASINGKIKAEVISMSVVSIFISSQEFNKDVQNICYADQLQPRFFH